jgi:hypothetical protein
MAKLWAIRKAEDAALKSIREVRTFKLVQMRPMLLKHNWRWEERIIFKMNNTQK